MSYDNQASTPTLSHSDFDMGTTVTINTNRVNTGVTHTVKYRFNGTSGIIADNVGASTTWTFPVEILAPQLPSSVQGIGTIILQTLTNDRRLIGTETVRFTARIPNSVVPVIGTVNVSEANSVVSNEIGAYVKSMSHVQAQLTGCSALYGASIIKHEVTLHNYSFDLTDLSNGGASSTNTVLPLPLDSAGSVAVVGKVTDSRGRAYQKTATFTVLDYALPNPAELTVQRCDSAGTLDPFGTYAKVTSRGAVSSLVVGSTEKNQLQYKLEYRETDGPTWAILKNTTTVAGLALDVTEILGGGNLGLGQAYQFRLTIYDKFNNVSISTRVGTSDVTLSLNKYGIGVGKVWAKGSVDAKDEIYQQNLTIPPTGTVVAFASSAAPTGWLLCNGSAVSRTEYARLFSVIGTTFGSGDGSTTFNTPNVKGRVIVGLDTGQSEFNVMGETGGAKTHTLTVSQIPSHTHTQDPHSHSVRWKSIVVGSEGGTTPALRPATSSYDGTNEAALEATATNKNTGGGGAHNNLQPYIAMNYIIKT